MKRFFIDTNIFLRAILGDHKTQSPKAQKFLKEIASQNDSYFTTSWVIAEIVWTLHSFYKIPKKRVVKAVESIISHPGIEVLESAIVVETLQLYETHAVDFVDCLNAVISRKQQAAGVVSFDKDFDALGAARIEPPFTP